MKRSLVCCVLICACIAISMRVASREIDKAGLRVMRALQENENPVNIDQGARGLVAATAVDSYCLIWYDFEFMNWQGWTIETGDAQPYAFFHVDDFAGLNGGSYDGLYPLQGLKSMWCGTRSKTDPRAFAQSWYLCSWQTAPGYGNSWDQSLTTGPVYMTGPITLSYSGYFDSEDNYDVTSVEYDSGNGNWIGLAAYDGVVDTSAVHTIVSGQAATKLRFHFTSDAAWSDQDGLWDSDGAAIIDEITVSDASGVLDYENWEDEPLDVTVSGSGFWFAATAEPQNSYAALMCDLVDRDPCGENTGTQIVFFNGSTIPSPDYPGLFVTPFCENGGGTEAPCQNEAVISPVIAIDRYSSGRNENQDLAIPPEALPNLGGTVLRFCVMRDLPLANLVFYQWEIREIVDGCPSDWQTRDFIYYGSDADYAQFSYDVSDLAGSNPLQVRLGVRDMCDLWFASYGDCAEHTPAPWFDSVRLYKYDSSGPRWFYRDLDLFQDNFPSLEFDIESWVRADCANDLRAGDDPVIDPGDSIVVTCSAVYAGGLDTLGTGEDRVYCHVRADYIGLDGLKPDLFGPSLEGTYGAYVSDDGEWTVFLMPNARSSSGYIQANRYMFDLNDSLLTRGYQVDYYFKAYSAAGASSCLPETAEETGGELFEFTCLPTLNSENLFVDDYHGRGSLEGTVQTYWDATFVEYYDFRGIDRYDVNSPSSAVSNGPGSRAYIYQMTNSYTHIIWDSGDLSSCTISDGTSSSDKSNDAQMLLDWMDQSEHKVGLWVMGDAIASDLDVSPAPCALELLSTKCGVTLVHNSYFDLTGGRAAGGIPSPEVTGIGIYEDIQYYAFGGCPVINNFDVLEKTGTGQYSLQLPDYGEDQYYIGISNSQLNNAGYPMRTSWIGHSMMFVRNGNLEHPVRENLLHETWAFFEEELWWTDADEVVPARYALMQNIPNPFNPSTTISFDLPAKAKVSLKVYDVAGRLIRTLTDSEFDAGRHSITWDGRNESGSGVASGVYFYKLESKDFSGTKKMVLLR